MIYLLLKRCYLCGHSTEGQRVMVIPRYLACDTVSSSCPWRMYWVLVIVLFLVTRMTWHFSKLKLIFHFLVHLLSVLRSSWSAAAFILGLKAIYIMVSSEKESNCRSNIVWNVVNVKKGIGRDQVQYLEGLLMLHGLQRRPRPLLVLFGICRLKTL